MSQGSHELAIARTRDPISLVKQRSLEDFADRLDSSKIVRGILRRVWIILLSAIVFALIFGYLSHRLASRFVASSYLLYEEDTSRRVAGLFPLTRISQASAMEMVTLPTNLNAVRSILGLELSEKELRSMVTVVPPPADSNLLNIKVTADSPSLAIDLANTLASVVVKSTKDYAKRQLNNAQDYYKGLIESLQQRLSERTKEITQFQREHTSFEFGSTGSIAVRSFADLEQRRQGAVESYNSQLIEYENLRREADRIPDQIVRYAAVESPLRQRLAQAELNLLEAKTRYAIENPKIKTLEEEIAQLKKLLQEPSQQEAKNSTNPNAEYEKNPVKENLNLELLTLRGKLRSAQKLKEDIEDQLRQQSKALDTLPEEQVAYNRLLDSREQLDAELKQSTVVLKTIEALMSVGKSGVEVYQVADRAMPNESLLIRILPLLGLFLGAGVGFFVALMIELADRRLRTAKEIEAFYNMPCLTTIPEFRFFSRTSGEIQLQYFIRTLEERLERFTSSLASFSIAILSSVHGEGKSTLVYFLTRYYQELRKRCVVIEADGASRVDDRNEVRASRSLEDYLREEASVEEIVSSGAIDRIQSVKDPHLKELLKGERMHRLLTDLKQYYEVILIDVPGIVEADYAANFAEAADISLFLVGSSKVPANIIETSLHELERHDVRPVGIVLNRVLRIYLDDVRIQAETKRTKVGIFSRIASWIRRK